MNISLDIHIYIYLNRTFWTIQVTGHSCLCGIAIVRATQGRNVCVLEISWNKSRREDRREGRYEGWVKNLAISLRRLAKGAL